MVVASIALLASLPAQSPAARAQDDFFKGKTIRVLVGATAGGGNDFFARIFAKHFGRHVPGNPAVLVVNAPGAVGMVAAGQLYNNSPCDGTVLAALQRNVPMAPLLEPGNVPFDAQKLNWLGSLIRETNLIIAWHTAPERTADGLFTRELIVGSSGGGADTLIYPILLNKSLGTRFKVVAGYSGGDGLDLAMERGETQGRASQTWTTLSGSRGQWLRDGKVRVIAQLALQRAPELPDVVNMLEHVKDPVDRQVFELLLSRQETGRPLAAPPETPPERVAMLRRAFYAVAEDPDLLADMKARGGSIELLEGEEMETLIAHLYRAPPQIVAKTREALAAKER